MVFSFGSDIHNSRCHLSPSFLVSPPMFIALSVALGVLAYLFHRAGNHSIGYVFDGLATAAILLHLI
jgi:hypothetical protein